MRMLAVAKNPWRDCLAVRSRYPNRNAIRRPERIPPPCAQLLIPGNEQPEEDQPHDPAHRLPVDRLTVKSAPALSIIEDGADQAADAGGGPDGEGNAGQVGDEESLRCRSDVEDRETVRGRIRRGQRAPVACRAIMLKKIWRIPPWRKEAEMRVHQRPYVNRHGSRRPEDQEAVVRRGQERHGVRRKAEGVGLDQERKE